MLCILIDSLYIHFVVLMLTMYTQLNGKSSANGAAVQKQKCGSATKSKESFEPIPLLAAILTYLGFYFLMLCGYLNQLLFKPKVAIEKNREVSEHVTIRMHIRIGGDIIFICG